MIAEVDECVNVLGDHALLITVRKECSGSRTTAIASGTAVLSTEVENTAPGMHLAPR
jgi:hypothetical protein